VEVIDADEGGESEGEDNDEDNEDEDIDDDDDACKFSSSVALTTCAI
jgi:hypothetical protein